jgi:membrane protease YdiL (CAAX protease family)
MNTVVIRLIGFALTLIIMIVMMKIKKLSFKETLAINKPVILDAIKYGILFLIWIAATEFLTYKLGLLETGQWEAYSTPHIILRALSICIVAPITEELVFRGLLFTRVKGKFGVKAAIFIPAILFALLHLKLGDDSSNENIFVVITFIDAVYYAFVRYKTNSIYIPILLHAIGNSIGLIERLY